MKTLNFTDRLTYLAWREEWKAAYAELSLNIRQTKPMYKELQRQITFAVVAAGKPWQHNQPQFEGKPLSFLSAPYVTQMKLCQMRYIANEMIELLGKAKVKSGVQRAAMIAERFPETSLSK